MGCKPSKESDQVAKGTMQKLNMEQQSHLSKKETTKALVSNPIPDESKDNQIFNKPIEDLIVNNDEENVISITDKPEESLLVLANKIDDYPISDKTEEGSIHDNESAEEVVLDKATEKEELEENEEEENVLGKAIEKEEIEEKDEEDNVLDKAIEKERIEEKAEEVNVLDEAVEKEETEENEEEIVIEANNKDEGEELGSRIENQISSVVDSPDSFAPTKDEVKGEMEKVEGEDGNSSNKKESADLKEMILTEEKEMEARMEEKENVQEGAE